MKDLKKVIRDGKVGVLYSPRYGAGWYSWNTEVPQCLYSPEIIALVEADKRNEITDALCQKLFGVKYFCAGGAEDLKIEWLPIGTQFRVDEYDGLESIQTMSELNLIA